MDDGAKLAQEWNAHRIFLAKEVHRARPQWSLAQIDDASLRLLVGSLTHEPHASGIRSSEASMVVERLLEDGGVADAVAQVALAMQRQDAARQDAARQDAARQDAARQDDELVSSAYQTLLERDLSSKGGSLGLAAGSARRRRHGAFYTPDYIVRRMVHDVLGKPVRMWIDEAISLLGQERYADAVAAATRVLDLRIVDPSCGCGSFLLGTLRFLTNELDRYNRAVAGRYGTDTSRERDDVPMRVPGVASRIASGCLFGVDLDENAVHIARLLLAREVDRSDAADAHNPAGPFRASTDSIDAHANAARSAAADRVDSCAKTLRCVANNVRWGNGLLDFSSNPLISRHHEESRRHEHAAVVETMFDWTREFSGIFDSSIPEKRRGFDVVIGNPPYFNIDATYGHDSVERELLKIRYPDVHTDKTDILYYFLAKGLEVLVPGGELGFVVSRAFIEAHKARKLRRLLSAETTLLRVVDFGGHELFPAGIAVLLLQLRKGPAPVDHRVVVDHVVDFSAVRNALQSDCLAPDAALAHTEVPQASLGASPWQLSPYADLFRAIDDAGGSLRALPFFDRAQQGVQTGDNETFVGSFSGEMPASYLHECVKSSGITAFGLRPSARQLLYVTTAECAFAELPSEVQAHLRRSEPRLRRRAAVREGSCAWFALHRAREDGAHTHFRPKILVPYRAGSARFAVDESGRVAGLTDTTALFVKDDRIEVLHFLCALLNSPVLEFRFRALGGLGKLTGKGMFEYFKTSIQELPIVDPTPGGVLHREFDALVDLGRSAHRLARDRLSRGNVAIRSVVEESDAEREVRRAIADVAYRLYRVDRYREQIELALALAR